MTDLKLNDTIGEVAALRLGLSVTRLWANELAIELKRWIDYAEDNGDHHPSARKMLETWEAQSDTLDRLVPLDDETKEEMKHR